MLERENTKYYSDMQEKRVAQFLGWKQVSGSGARAGRPGDVEGERFLGECKTHTKPGAKLHFNRRVWNKLSDEAMVRFRSPILIVDDGSQNINHTWCMFTRLHPEVNISMNNVKEVEFKKQRGANINISYPDLCVMYQDIFGQYGITDGIFITKFDGATVAMCPLTVFKSIME